MQFRWRLAFAGAALCMTLTAAGGARAQTADPTCDADKLAYAQKIGVPCSALGERLPNPPGAPVAAAPQSPSVRGAILNAEIGPPGGEAPPPPPGMALIYIYRAPTIVCSMTPADFDIDRIGIGGLWNREYTWFYVPAGDHRINQVWGGLALISIWNLEHRFGGVLHWEAGQTYYYEFKIDLDGIYLAFMRYRTTLRTVGAEEAQGQMSIFKYRPAKHADQLSAEKIAQVP